MLVFQVAGVLATSFCRMLIVSVIVNLIALLSVSYSAALFFHHFGYYHHHHHHSIIIIIIIIHHHHQHHHHYHHHHHHYCSYIHHHKQHVSFIIYITILCNTICEKNNNEFNNTKLVCFLSITSNNNKDKT